MQNPSLAKVPPISGGLRQVVNPSPRPGSAAVGAKPVIVNNNAAAKIYKNPVIRRETPTPLVQKSSDKKVVDIRKRPLSAGLHRPLSVERESVDSAVVVPGNDRKTPTPQSYLEQQRQKRAFEEALALKKKHQELIEKQKVSPLLRY
jgi:hypothetical protein